MYGMMGLQWPSVDLEWLKTNSDAWLLPRGTEVQVLLVSEPIQVLLFHLSLRVIGETFWKKYCSPVVYGVALR